MKGVNIIRNESNNKRFLQIDLSLLDQHPEEIENIIDIVVAALRKDEEEISWEEVKKEVNKKQDKK